MAQSFPYDQNGSESGNSWLSPEMLAAALEAEKRAAALEAEAQSAQDARENAQQRPPTSGTNFSGDQLKQFPGGPPGGPQPMPGGPEPFNRGPLGNRGDPVLPPPNGSTPLGQRPGPELAPPPPSRMSGLLDFIKTPAGQGLLSTVFGGLAGARRGEPFNSLGRAGMAGMAGYGGALDRDAQMAQLMQKNSLISHVDPSKVTPESLAKFYVTRNYGDLRAIVDANQEGRTSQQKNWDFSNTLSPEQRVEFLAGFGSDGDPSSIREWKVYSPMTPEQQQKYREMKRAIPMQDMGGYVAPAIGGGQLGAPIPKTLTPGELPVTRGEQAKAASEGQEVGKAIGDKTVKLTELKTALPGLEKIASDLHELGKRATYTAVGQGIDTVRRQTGMSMSDGAIARKEYISKVDNEVLPLLRATFGAQFTQKEGESLKVTLGDPNASPEEKDSVLRAFIQAKRAQIKGLEGTQPGVINKPAAPKVDQLPTANSTNKGQRYKDDSGKILKSNGMQWIEEK